MGYDLPPELRVSADGAIRIVTLNRPDELNAVNEPLHRALGQVWRQLLDDEDARAVIVTGAGRAFSAGGDFTMLEQIATDPQSRYRSMIDARRIVSEMVSFPLPIIAAINGPAVGLGCSIAVLCDLVLMSDHAYFMDPHVSIGLVAADGGVLAWPAFMSLLKAKEYLLTGDRIPATEAERIGLANRIVPSEDLMVEAMAMAQRLASQPRQALLDTKRALNLHLKRMVTEVIDFAFSAESETFGSEEFASRLQRMASHK